MQDTWIVKENFFVGQEVVLHSPEHCYSSYEDMARAMGAEAWRRGECNAYKGMHGIIHNMKPHLTNLSMMLYLVRFNDREFILGGDAIQAVKDQSVIGNRNNYIYRTKQEKKEFMKWAKSQETNPSKR